MLAPWPRRFAHGSVAFEDKIWVIGGLGPTVDGSEADIWSSPDGIDWERTTEFGGFVSDSFAAVVYEGEIWKLGGQMDNIAGVVLANDVWASSDGTAWRLVAESAPWSPRGSHTGVVFDHKIWIMGGLGGGDQVWYLEVTNAASRPVWSQYP